ncbi:hypothetical protein [Actinoplanes lobatus]|uniref:Uncharacterized protein n=1 Tax=Actinoplanes lobatus TaxID=113568 RepID=A0A7W7HRD2_9ACTN|nr:hypothetical protein [Actinoplanes lobatus]MBB4755077.1 hypothetical protein [Actinoplanes lobatus]
MGLNIADGPYGAIETGERKELAEYIDAVLTTAGVDVAALTARRGRHRGELTDSSRWLVTGRARNGTSTPILCGSRLLEGVVATLGNQHRPFG